LTKNKEDNIVIEKNIKLRKQSNQLKWTANNKTIQELTDIINITELQQELKTILEHIDTHISNEKYQKELDELKIIMTWYNNYEQIIELKRDIDTIQNKITLLETIVDETDTLNEIKRLKKQRLLRDKVLKIKDAKKPLIEQITKQKEWDELKELQSKLDASKTYNDKKEIIKEKEKLQKNNTDIEDKLKICQNMYNEQEEKYRLDKEHLSILQYRKSANKKVLNDIKILDKELMKLETDIIPLQDYNDIMGNKGITSKLLFNKIKAVEEYINCIISNFTRYTIIIMYDEKKQTMNIITKNKDSDNYLSIGSLSGYEKLIMQVSFKRALNKFSYNSKSSLIIIDEALDCLDQINFITVLPEVINLVTQDYSMCLAISQRSIEHISDNIITLECENDISYIVH